MKLDELTERIKHLPTLPQVALRLTELVSDPDVSVDEIHRILSRDPALASRMLRLVNSAFYGLPRKVSSLKHAVVLLGLRSLRNLVLSVSVFDTFKSGEGAETFDREGFWRHSIGSACIYQALAVKIGRVDPESAFVCGLLHDIGKLVIDVYAPDEMARVLNHAETQGISFIAAERALLETDHAQVGAWLLEKWGLPPLVVEAVRKHHIPFAPTEEVSPEVEVLRAIAVFADYLCKVKRIAASGSHDPAHLDREGWVRLGLVKDDLPILIGQVNEEIERADEFLVTVDGGEPSSST